MAEIKLIINASELGAGTRGASLGVDAMEIAALNAGNSYFSEYRKVEIPTSRMPLYESIATPFAKHINGIKSVYKAVSKEVSETLKQGDFPIVLAGDHSSAGGTIAGVKIAHPEKRIGVVWIDAHGDLHSPYTSPTGNVHGMPLATALGVDNEANQINQVNEETKSHWEELKHLGNIFPKISPSDLVFFGVRDTETPEENLMESLGIRNYKVDETRFRGLHTCIREAIEQLQGCDEIYISFDVDSMDSNLISHGTGTPVPYGFDQEEVMAIMQSLISTGKVCCLELVEVNPTLDEKKNKMAEVAFNILQGLTEDIAKKIE